MLNLTVNGGSCHQCGLQGEQLGSPTEEPLALGSHENVVYEEGHCTLAGGVIIRQIERVSLREEPAGEIGRLGVGKG